MPLVRFPFFFCRKLGGQLPRTGPHNGFGAGAPYTRRKERKQLLSPCLETYGRGTRGYSVRVLFHRRDAFLPGEEYLFANQLRSSRKQERIIGRKKRGKTKRPVPPTHRQTFRNSQLRRETCLEDVTLTFYRVFLELPFSSLLPPKAKLLLNRAQSAAKAAKHTSIAKHAPLIQTQ